MWKRLLSLCLYAALSLPNAFACTTVIVSAGKSSTGRPLMLKVRDTEDSFNHIEHFLGSNYSFTALVNSRDSARLSVWAGANDRGFCIMNSVSYNLRPDSLENKPYEGMVMKEALGTCATVDEFEDFLMNMPKPCGLETNYGVIDAVGGAAYFEVWDYGYTRFDVSEAADGYLVRTNFSLSGRKDEGRGYVRYESARKLLADQAPKKISPRFLIDGIARSFYHATLGRDLSKGRIPRNGLVNVDDCIPRPTTTAYLVFEDVAQSDQTTGTVLWCALGYPPVCAAIPIRIADGDDIPEALRKPDLQALERKEALMPVTRDGGRKYLNMRTLRSRILPAVRRTEKKEFRRFKKNEP